MSCTATGTQNSGPRGAPPAVPAVERFGLRHRMGIEREEGVEWGPTAGVEVACGDLSQNRFDHGGAPAPVGAFLGGRGAGESGSNESASNMRAGADLWATVMG